MIIGLTGYAQSGKDTVAQILVKRYGFTRVAFADPIREFAYDVNPIVDTVANEKITLRYMVDRDGWEGAKKHEEVRKTLQRIGVAARNNFGDDFWIIKAMEKVKHADRIVVTDVRFINEAKWIKNYEQSQIWRIKRLGIGAVNNHVSESEMDGYKVDQILVNNGTLDELDFLINTRMRVYAESTQKA